MKSPVPVLRNSLVPQGTLNVVRLGFHDGPGGNAFFDQSFVNSVLDCLDRRLLLAAAQIDELNPLEKLACQLLLSSAYVSEPADLATAQKNLERFNERTKNEEDA